MILTIMITTITTQALLGGGDLTSGGSTRPICPELARVDDQSTPNLPTNIAPY